MPGQESELSCMFVRCIEFDDFSFGLLNCLNIVVFFSIDNENVDISEQLISGASLICYTESQKTLPIVQT